MIDIIIFSILFFLLGFCVGVQRVLRRAQEMRKQHLVKWLDYVSAEDFNFFDWYKKWKRG